MKKVYLLYHQYTKDSSSYKIIGYYSSYEKVLIGKKQVEDQPGFLKYPNNFFVQIFEIDKDGCTETIQIE